jgi:hypothetical protein
LSLNFIADSIIHSIIHSTPVRHDILLMIVCMLYF